jgi:alpha-ribazole phosphatase
MLVVWRHPRPRGVAGRCIGRTDVAVDRRRAKRLAHRIRQAVRKQGLPRCVFTSPLVRCALVGRLMRRMGFVHRIDPDLLELDFGAWDGRAWADIAMQEVAAWEADFVGHAPGGGEALAALFERAQRFLARQPQGLVVGHAGWITACEWLQANPGVWPTAAQWPRGVGYGRAVWLSLDPAVDRLTSLAKPHEPKSGSHPPAGNPSGGLNGAITGAMRWLM